MYTFESRIRYSEADSDGKLTMASLLNYFQDCSTFQSEDLGVGVGYMQDIHMVWALSSWQIVVNRYPDVCEKVKIGTIPYGFKGFLGYRNFVMQSMEGETLAVANSLWCLLNLKTGKPDMPTSKILESYQLGEKLPMDYAPRKIAIPASGEEREPIVIKKHHLDTNHHVNNGQYVSIAMEFLPEDFAVAQLRAEYKKQSFLDDVLYPCVSAEPDRCVINLADAEGNTHAAVEFLRKEP